MSETTDFTWQEHNFTGRIYLLRDDRKVPIHLSTSTELPVAKLIANDWLESGGTKATKFSFKFHSQTPGRLNHHIYSTHYAVKRQLMISDSGYLGLYLPITQGDFFKLEPLAITERSIRCRIRDHLGHQVKVESNPRFETEDVAFLTVGDGLIHEYLIERA